MADFVDQGSLGATGSSANNQATLVLTLAASVSKGDLMIVVVADDNRLGSADADGSEVSSVQANGSPATAFTKIIGWSNNNAAAQAGASCSLWAGIAKADLTTSNTITATFTSSTLSDATAMTARRFTYSSAGLLTVVGVGPTNTLSNDAADPGSLDATTVNAEHLRIRGIGAEVGNNTSLTPTAGWTAWDNGNSAATGTSAEMCARAEHHISTGTSDASDPTYVAADCASVYATFRTFPLPFSNLIEGRAFKLLSAPSFDPPNLLLTTLAPTEAAIIFGVTSPSPSFRPLAALPFDPPNLLTTTLAPAPQTGFVFRGPLIATISKSRKAPEFDPPNLLLNTLAPAQQEAPIFGTVSDRPSFKPISAQEFQPPNLLTTTLAPAQAATPFAQYDWPNPSFNRFTAKVFDHQNNLLLMLSVKPFAQYDWPAPTPKRLNAIQFDPPNLLLTTLAPFIQPPFFGLPSDRPAFPRFKAPVFEQPNLLPTLLSTPIVMPPIAGIYDSSARPRRISAIPFDPPNTAITVLSAPVVTPTRIIYIPTHRPRRR